MWLVEGLAGEDTSELTADPLGSNLGRSAFRKLIGRGRILYVSTARTKSELWDTHPNSV